MREAPGGFSHAHLSHEKEAQTGETQVFKTASRAALHLDTRQARQSAGRVASKIRKDRTVWSQDSAIEAGTLVHLTHFEGTQSYHSWRLPNSPHHSRHVNRRPCSSRVRGMEWEGPMGSTVAEASTSVRPSSKSQGYWWSQFELWSFWNPAALVDHLTRTKQPSQGWKATRFKAAISQEYSVTKNAYTPKDYQSSLKPK